MREHQFRIWDKSNKMFLDPHGICLFGDGGLCSYYRIDALERLPIDGCILQYSIGVQDAKGKDIFDGDILSVDYGDCSGVGVVSYYKVGYCILSRYGAPYQDTIPTMEHSIIIGNICTDPEIIRPFCLKSYINAG